MFIVLYIYVEYHKKVPKVQQIIIHDREQPSSGYYLDPVIIMKIIW